MSDEFEVDIYDHIEGDITYKPCIDDMASSSNIINPAISADMWNEMNEKKLAEGHVIPKPPTKPPTAWEMIMETIRDVIQHPEAITDAAQGLADNQATQEIHFSFRDQTFSAGTKNFREEGGVTAESWLAHWQPGITTADILKGGTEIISTRSKYTSYGSESPSCPDKTLFKEQVSTILLNLSAMKNGTWDGLLALTGRKPSIPPDEKSADQLAENIMENN